MANKFKASLKTQSGYEGSMSKEIAHTILMKHVVDKMRDEKPKTRPNIVSFPGTSFRWESAMHDTLHGNLKLTCLESDPKVFEKGRKLMDAMELPADYRMINDLDFWKTEDQEQDIVWLDYCGPWSRLKSDAIETLFSHKRLRFGKTGPLLALTVMDGMDLRMIGDLMLLANTRTKQFKARIGGIPQWIDCLARDHGRSAELKFLLHYRDCTRARSARPMLLFILEIHPKVIDFDVWKVGMMDLLQDNLMGMGDRVKR